MVRVTPSVGGIPLIRFRPNDGGYMAQFEILGTSEDARSGDTVQVSTRADASATANLLAADLPAAPAVAMTPGTEADPCIDAAAADATAFVSSAADSGGADAPTAAVESTDIATPTASSRVQWTSSDSLQAGEDKAPVFGSAVIASDSRFVYLTGEYGRGFAICTGKD